MNLDREVFVEKVSALDASIICLWLNFIGDKLTIFLDASRDTKVVYFIRCYSRNTRNGWNQSDASLCIQDDQVLKLIMPFK